MILTVPLSDFASTLKEFGGQSAFIRKDGDEIVITGHLRKEDQILVSFSNEKEEAIRESLQKSDLVLRDGGWDIPNRKKDKLSESSLLYIAVVAYKSDEPTPGIWVDSFPYKPTEMQVLNAIYEEFRTTGEIGNVSFDHFVKIAHPNVLILSPKDVERFIQRKALQLVTGDSLNSGEKSEPEVQVECGNDYNQVTSLKGEKIK